MILQSSKFKFSILKYVATIFLLVAFITCFQFSAEAQVSNSSGVSTGTAIAASFENMGYRGQELVETVLSGLFTKLGVLIFVLTAIAGLTTYIISNRLDFSLWFLVGPILFYFVTYTTTVAGGVEWRFGNYTPPNPDKALLLAPVNSKVSWLFHTYNRLISGIDQELIKLFSGADSKKVLKKFMTREQILTRIMSFKLENTGLSALLVNSVAQCNKPMNSARILARGKRDPLYVSTTEYKTALANYQTEMTNPTQVVLSGPSQQYVNRLLYDINANTMKLPSDSQAISGCLNIAKALPVPSSDSENFEQPVSCTQLWCLMGLGIYNSVELELAQEQDRLSLDAPLFEELKRDLSQKLADPQEYKDLKGNYLQGDSPTMPDASIIPVVISGFIVRDAIRDGDLHSGFMSRFGERSGLGVERKNLDISRAKEDGRDAMLADTATRTSQNLLVQENQYDIHYMMMLMPHLQGIFLYALAYLFPFFALLLLVPGKASGFLIWFAMWAWVKSWDVLWCLVMQLEDLLWQMMPHSSVFNPLVDPNQAPITVFESAFDGDPAYSLATYFLILSTLMMAVPTFSAQLFLGAKAQFFLPIIQGVKSLSSFVGSSSRTWAQVEQSAHYEQIRENFLINRTAGKVGFDGLQNITDKPYVSFMTNQIKTLEGYKAELDKMRGDTLIDNQDMLQAAGLTSQSGVVNRRAADLSLTYGRMISSAKTDMIRFNTTSHWLDGGSTLEWTTLDGLRNAQTGRGEHWNFSESAVGLYKDINMSVINRTYGVLNSQQSGMTAIRNAATKPYSP